MSSFNDHQDAIYADRMAAEHKLANCIAPQHILLGAIAECATEHLKHNDIAGAEVILNALQYAMQSARAHAQIELDAVNARDV